MWDILELHSHAPQNETLEVLHSATGTRTFPSNHYPN